MKHFLGLALSMITLSAVAQKRPEVMKTEFTKESLSQYVYTPQGDSLTMKDVLKKHKKRVVVLDLWAGWCKDCIAVMDENEHLKQQYSKVKFIYLSLDRSDTAWTKAMDKYNLKKEENYWFKAGWKNSFTNNIDLNWIPRYMVVDQKSKIKGYYFVHPKEPEFKALLDELSKK